MTIPIAGIHAVVELVDRTLLDEAETRIRQLEAECSALRAELEQTRPDTTKQTVPATQARRRTVKRSAELKSGQK